MQLPVLLRAKGKRVLGVRVLLLAAAAVAAVSRAPRRGRSSPVSLIQTHRRTVEIVLFTRTVASVSVDYFIILQYCRS